MEQGQYEQAVPYYRQSLKQIPNWPPALWGLADALLAMDRGAEALPYLTILAENGDSEALAQLQKLISGEK